MRPPAVFSTLALAPLLCAVFVACSSSSSSTTPSSTASAVQGPLSGTYSADSLDGDAPFITITFTDVSHYQYVAKSCVPQDSSEPGAGDDDDAADGGTVSYSDLGADPGDQVADNGATPDYDADPTDNGCIHTGTYAISPTQLSLTDDGASTAVSVDLAQLDPDGTEVSDPSVTLTTAQSQVLENVNELHPDALTGTTTALFGSASVSQFKASGTSMRRTGLANGSGVGSACVIGSGVSGTCMTTTSCSALGSHVSTPDYCPGPANVQCCTSTSATSSGSMTNDTMGALVQSSAVGAAEQWVSAKVPYCQAVNGGRELDLTCYNVTGRTCTRSGAANNSLWNKYRSDCSGFVSYAWTLAAPGLTTSGFLPSKASYIPMQDLQPGDALIRPGTHMVLFQSWANKAAGTANVLSEPGCAASGGPYAQHQTWSMGKAPGATTSAHWAGSTYYSIRKKGSTLTQ